MKLSAVKILPVLGLRANAAQFALLAAVNALVGGMVGQQQTVLPLLAHAEFGLRGPQDIGDSSTSTHR